MNVTTDCRIIVVMGVSGSGKSTVARKLAEQLAWPFQEGDDLHPQANIDKMQRGQPLDDADRAPWLAKVAEWIDARRVAREPGVITCSALKRGYRDGLDAGRPELRFLYLRVRAEVLEERLRKRKGHFMPAELLHSQLATLEEPTADEPAIVIEIDDLSPEESVQLAIERLGGGLPRRK